MKSFLSCILRKRAEGRDVSKLPPLLDINGKAAFAVRVKLKAEISNELRKFSLLQLIYLPFSSSLSDEAVTTTLSIRYDNAIQFGADESFEGIGEAVARAAASAST